MVSRWNVNCKNLAVQLELNQYPKSNAPAADTHAQRWRLSLLVCARHQRARLYNHLDKAAT